MFQPAPALPGQYEVLECLYRKNTNDSGDASAVFRIRAGKQIWCLKQISTEKRYAVRSIRRFEASFPAASPVRRSSLLVGHHGHRLEGDKLLYFQEYLPNTLPLCSSARSKDASFRSRFLLDVLLLQRRLLQEHLLFSDLDERNLVVDETGRVRILDLEGLLCVDDSCLMELFFSFYSVNLASLLMNTVLQTGWDRGRFLEGLGCPLFHREQVEPHRAREVAKRAAGPRSLWVPVLEAILAKDPVVLAPEFYEYLANLHRAAAEPRLAEKTEGKQRIGSPLPEVGSCEETTVSPQTQLPSPQCGRGASGEGEFHSVAQSPASPGASELLLPSGRQNTTPCADPSPLAQHPLARGRGTEISIASQHAEPVEQITWMGQHVATIIRKDYLPDKTTFVTPDNYYQQAGMVVYPKGGVIKRHLHLPIQRHLVGTSEALMVKKGRVEADLHAMDKSFLGTWILEQGDLILLAGGGHGFRCLEDTVLMEIKQGPYTGLVEKEHF